MSNQPLCLGTKVILRVSNLKITAVFEINLNSEINLILNRSLNLQKMTNRNIKKDLLCLIDIE